MENLGENEPRREQRFIDTPADPKEIDALVELADKLLETGNLVYHAKHLWECNTGSIELQRGFGTIDGEDKLTAKVIFGGMSYPEDVDDYFLTIGFDKDCVTIPSTGKAVDQQNLERAARLCAELQDIEELDATEDRLITECIRAIYAKLYGIDTGYSHLLKLPGDSSLSCAGAIDNIIRKYNQEEAVARSIEIAYENNGSILEIIRFEPGNEEDAQHTLKLEIKLYLGQGHHIDLSMSHDGVVNVVETFRGAVDEIDGGEPELYHIQQLRHAIATTLEHYSLTHTVGELSETTKTDDDAEYQMFMKEALEAFEAMRVAEQEGGSLALEKAQRTLQLKADRFEKKFADRYHLMTNQTDKKLLPDGMIVPIDARNPLDSKPAGYRNFLRVQAPIFYLVGGEDLHQYTMEKDEMVLVEFMELRFGKVADTGEYLPDIILVCRYRSQNRQQEYRIPLSNATVIGFAPLDN